jgi:hypothetical protein
MRLRDDVSWREFPGSGRGRRSRTAAPQVFVAVTPDDPSTARGAPRLTPLTDDLRAFIERTGERATSIGALLEALDERGTAVLTILLAAPFVLPIPLPGLSLPFGAAIAVLGVRLGFGKPPWLPAFLLRRPIQPQTLASIVRAVQRVATPVERRLRPRWPFLFGPAMHIAIGIAIAAAALLLLPPFPMPGINALPSLAIVLFGLGMLERDGAAILAGGVVLAVAYAYLYLWWDVAVRVLRQVAVLGL